MFMLASLQYIQTTVSEVILKYKNKDPSKMSITNSVELVYILPSWQSGIKGVDGIKAANQLALK